MHDNDFFIKIGNYKNKILNETYYELVICKSVNNNWMELIGRD